MAKRVFFSFHYKDVSDFRANVVRNSWITQDRKASGFFDASIWEEAKKKGVKALKRLIADGLKNTSVSCVLIGTDTYSRRWVRYEIIKSLAKGNGIFGVYIHNIKDKYGNVAIQGHNPFDYLAVKYNEEGNYLSFLEYKNGQWINYKDHDGYSIKSDIANRGKALKLSSFYNTYDWVFDDGYTNFNKWVDKVSK
ncbi:TIR-like protein DUF1863 [Halanaerobium congolense]|uniref:TIR-like protein DUF1863 n=1 Tax=Halanaerobium congolense TaxID=54121 RepID=A0A4R8G3X5_9FIRM|nr:TIR domain-containing protein [Halanaerobium congolense]TDX36565.1 TIR-like protein DUF1863 [Halanaerobium congolense]